VTANPANPSACFERGSIVNTMVKASGIMTPPANPCRIRNTIISPRLLAWPHSAENSKNSAVLAIK
jgi:hypothetical protein